MCCVCVFSVPIRYSSFISPFTTVTSYTGRSKDFTVAVTGVITQWKILTAVWPTGIKSYIYKNDELVDEVWVNDQTDSVSTVMWRTVFASAPISVTPGDTIHITHTSLETYRTYEIAINPDTNVAHPVPLIAEFEVTVDGNQVASPTP